jgi:DNA replication and repair protein RecF
MHLESLELLNFKNYEEIKLQFSPEINCLVGSNGSGKTNMLDAIHYLSLTKSAFNAIDSQNIRHEADFMVIRGTFRSSDSERHNPQKEKLGNSESESHETAKKIKPETIQCSLQQGQRKILKHNKKVYDKISEHIGRYPVVLITPNDTDVIREGSETRRKFFDSILSQIDQQYLQELLQYNHNLKQRNSLLKQFSERNSFDKDLLEPYNQHLLRLGQTLLQARKKFLQEYMPSFLSHYQNLSEGKEEVSIRFESNLDVDKPAETLFKSLRRDLMLQRSNIGIHKDDYIFEIEGHPLKKFGSQGQQKSFVIALKLAQFDLIRHHKGFKPILLLDDIFDKLDDQRIAKLMELVSGHTFGQLFVTDARPERTERIFEQLTNTEVMIFKIAGGQAELLAQE